MGGFIAFVNCVHVFNAVTFRRIINFMLQGDIWVNFMDRKSAKKQAIFETEVLKYETVANRYGNKNAGFFY